MHLSKQSQSSPSFSPSWIATSLLVCRQARLRTLPCSTRVPQQESSKLPPTQNGKSFHGRILRWPCSFEYEPCFNWIQLCFCRSVCLWTSLTISFAWTVAFVSDLILCFLSLLYKCVPTLLKLPKFLFYTNEMTHFSVISFDYQQWTFSCLISNVLCLM